MKKSIGTSTFLGVMCLAVMPMAPAYAANWVYVTESDSKSVFYYDSDTIQRAGNQVTVWIKIDNSRDRSVKQRGSTDRVRYDCGDRTSIILQRTSYYPDGKNETFDWSTYKRKEDPIIPDTLNEDIFEAVCQ